VAAQATDVNAATRHGQTILITLMHANPNFWPMARALLNWGFKAYGKVDPVGTLVQPLPPAATVANTQTVSNHTLGQSSLRPGHSSRLPMFPLEVVAAAIVALGITTVGLRRRKERLRNRHYRSRLRLPPV
jgi:D-alanyl-D-alanine carboxypeptidase (penicillin-binding protein 5/6)